MAPLIALLSTVLCCLTVNALGVAPLMGWPVPLQAGLSVMFLLTASGHWGRMRPDLIRMVPPFFSGLPGGAPVLVTMTGIIEIAFAITLWVPELRVATAWGIVLLLVALLPANIYAARAGLTLGGKAVTPMGRRVIFQLIFIASALAVALAE